MNPAHVLALLLLFVSACHCGSDGISHPVPVTEEDAGNPNPSEGDQESPNLNFLIGIATAKEALLAGATTADLDNDGYQEYRRKRDSSGKVLGEEIDVDGNGTADLVWDYSGITKTFRADVDGNGIAESAIDVTAYTNDPDRHYFVVTEDSSGDGIPDVRRSYTLDPRQDTVDVLVEEDPDQDGSFPTQTTFRTTRVQDAHLATVNTSGPDACDASQKAAIDTAFDEAVSEGLACLNLLDRSLALQYSKVLAGANITISCGSSRTSCAHVDGENSIFHWYGWFDLIGKKDLPIFVDPPGFNRDGCGVARSTLKSNLFHELSHYVLGLHEVNNGTKDPQDRVYGCQKTCFGKATSQTCAQCLNKKNGVPACKRYPEEPCKQDVPRYCECNNEIYADELDCAVECPTGLACYFDSHCQPRGPCR